MITTGIQDDKNIVVLTGLEKGERVITGPYRTVTKTLKSGKLINSKKDKESKETTSEEAKEQ